MKAVKIIACICGGVYFAVAAYLLVGTLFSGMMGSIHTGGYMDNMFNMQRELGIVNRKMALCLLPGVAIGFLMAVKLRDLWKFVPLLSLVLIVGNIIWTSMLVVATKPLMESMFQNFMGMSAELGALTSHMAIVGLAIYGVIISVSPVLLLIFWNIGQKKMRQTALPDLQKIRY